MILFAINHGVKTILSKNVNSYDESISKIKSFLNKKSDFDRVYVTAISKHETMIDVGLWNPLFFVNVGFDELTNSTKDK